MLKPPCLGGCVWRGRCRRTTPVEGPGMEPLRNASDLRLDSQDKQTELMYLLRERMTLLQSQIELAQAQLSSMHSGKASRDLYSRVFLPLQDELEGTTRQYEAVVIPEAQPDRKSHRD